MQSFSYTEENYIKCIHHLCEVNPTGTSTNAIADVLHIQPATVTAMLKKLRAKNIVLYERYGKVQLTKVGELTALQIIRKHRLWEVFLVEKLHFTWDEVHEIAEQLEHISSTKLIDKLDAFLNHPKFDPHGDPIPSAAGIYEPITSMPLSQGVQGQSYKVLSVQDSSSEFLQHLMQLQITLHSLLSIEKHHSYDNSMMLLVNGKVKHTITERVAQQILVTHYETI